MRQVAVLALCLSVPVVAQNVGINATGAAPAAPAMLDVAATDRGVLIPRVALTAANNNAPVGAGVVQSLLVFNTATAGAGINAVTPGYYYWSGAPANRWVRFADDGDAWRITGNAGTVAATNFLGTTDAVALRLRTENFDRFEISPGTGAAAGTGGRLYAFQDGTAAAPIYSWGASTGMGHFRQAANVLGVATGGVERFRYPNANQVHAMAAGIETLPFYSWGADPNTGFWSGGADILGFSTAGVNRMRIMNTGQVVMANGIVAPAVSTTLTVNAAAAYPVAIRGVAANNGAGVFGQGNAAGVSDGVEGEGQQGGINAFGVWGRNTNAAAGNAIVGAGNNLGTFIPPAGSGGAFTGFSTASYHYYTTGGIGQAALMQDGFGAQWNVGYWNLGYFKIIGTGGVATVVKDNTGDRVVLVCPEAPEALFEDHGIGRLVNGRAMVHLDPTLTRNIRVDAEHPIKVFVQLEGECNGVYVTNKSASGFEVVELMGGTSTVDFAWSIVANRANEVLEGPNGTREADYGGRFVPAPTYQAPVHVEKERAAMRTDRP